MSSTSLWSSSSCHVNILFAFCWTTFTVQCAYNVCWKKFTFELIEIWLHSPHYSSWKYTRLPNAICQLLSLNDETKLSHYDNMNSGTISFCIRISIARMRVRACCISFGNFKVSLFLWEVPFLPYKNQNIMSDILRMKDSLSTEEGSLALASRLVIWCKES